MIKSGILKGVKPMMGGFGEIMTQKDVTVHSLRHSFAPHFLESGVDLRYIQEILGYKSSKTTEVYTHVSTKNLGKIISPIDTLNLNGGGEE